MAEDKYTHKTFESPGGPDPAVAPLPIGDYPRTLHAQDPADNVLVGNEEDEKTHLESGKWKLSPAEWAAALVLVILSLFALPLQAQTTVTQTTLSSALSAPSQGVTAATVNLASATGVTGPSGGAPGTELFVDQEAMLVTSITGTVAQVIRGYDASAGVAHASGAIVYAGPTAGVSGSPFVYQDPPLGACTLANEPYNLRINTRTGRISQCTNSIWMRTVDAMAWIGPGNCWYSVATGTLTSPTFGAVGVTALGLTTTVAVAPAVPVMQVATTNAAVISTNTITCQIPIPTRASASKGVYVVDASFAYGIQQTGGVAATQVAVEASGTMNGSLVFSQVVMPTAGAAETPSTVAPARWDSGTLTLTPAKASFNSLVTTAGQFFMQKFTPANPMAMASDLTEYLVSLPILCNTTQATTINVAGVLVHYRTVSDL